MIDYLAPILMAVIVISLVAAQCGTSPAVYVYDELHEPGKYVDEELHNVCYYTTNSLYCLPIER